MACLESASGYNGIRLKLSQAKCADFTKSGIQVFNSLSTILLGDDSRQKQHGPSKLAWLRRWFEVCEEKKKQQQQTRTHLVS